MLRLRFAFRRSRRKRMGEVRSSADQHTALGMTKRSRQRPANPTRSRRLIQPAKAVPARIESTESVVVIAHSEATNSSILGAAVLLLQQMMQVGTVGRVNAATGQPSTKDRCGRIEQGNGKNRDRRRGQHRRLFETAPDRQNARRTARSSCCRHRPGRCWPAGELKNRKPNNAAGQSKSNNGAERSARLQTQEIRGPDK